MRRRQFLTAAASLAGAVGIARAQELPAGGAGAHAVPHLLERFLALPGAKSAVIEVDTPADPWRVSFDADAQLFCGSCFKTFVLAAWLQEVEAGRLDEMQELAVDDGVRSPSSSVFGHLTGATAARNALEAMITHSDNTATDMAMQRVGADRVRRFIADAGVADARIPYSTRRFFSYVAGAPAGTDMGWKEIAALLDDEKQDTAQFRPALNDVETMSVPASQFVAYYKRALAGDFFAKPETLTEFKRIQATADAIASVVPADTPAYAKGGSIDWNGFHCMALAGQMIAREVPVTFALIHNWTDADGAQQEIAGAYKDAVADVLGKVHKRLSEARS